MIEVAFGDSIAGGLKEAKCEAGKKEILSEMVFIASSDEDDSGLSDEEIETARLEAVRRYEERKKNMVYLGGSPADVYGFSLCLSIGDISEKMPGAKRVSEMEKIFSIYPEFDEASSEKESDEESLESWVKSMPEQVNEALGEIKERAKNGEAIRIWYSDNPEELCGYYWFICAMADTPAEMYEIKLPKFDESVKNQITEYLSWNEVGAERFHRFLHLQKPISNIMRSHCRLQWQRLMEENAPLRVVLNGSLVSAPEDIYDSFIEREIEAENDEFDGAMILGRILGKCRLGIADYLVWKRLEKMIKNGRLHVVSESKRNHPEYCKKLKKTNI